MRWRVTLDADKPRQKLRPRNPLQTFPLPSPITGGCVACIQMWLFPLGDYFTILCSVEIIGLKEKSGPLLPLSYLGEVISSSPVKNEKERLGDIL